MKEPFSDKTLEALAAEGIHIERLAQLYVETEPGVSDQVRLHIAWSNEKSSGSISLSMEGVLQGNEVHSLLLREEIQRALKAYLEEKEQVNP